MDMAWDTFNLVKKLHDDAIEAKNTALEAQSFCSDF